MGADVLIFLLFHGFSVDFHALFLDRVLRRGMLEGGRMWISGLCLKVIMVIVARVVGVGSGGSWDVKFRSVEEGEEWEGNSEGSKVVICLVRGSEGDDEVRSDWDLLDLVGPHE